MLPAGTRPPCSGPPIAPIAAAATAGIVMNVIDAACGPQPYASQSSCSPTMFLPEPAVVMLVAHSLLRQSVAVQASVLQSGRPLAETAVAPSLVAATTWQQPPATALAGTARCWPLRRPPRLQHLLGQEFAHMRPWPPSPRLLPPGRHQQWFAQCYLPQHSMMPKALTMMQSQAATCPPQVADCGAAR